MNVDTRLALTGALTVLAGANYAPRQGWVVTVAVGMVILVAALWRDLMRLLAQPSVVRTRYLVPPSAVERGGLGAQNRSEGDFGEPR